MKKILSKPLTAIIAGTACLLLVASLMCLMTLLSGCSNGTDVPYEETEGNWAADPDDPAVIWAEEEQKRQMNAEISEVFHDQAGIYMVPYEPKTTDPVTIRLRADRYNITSAEIYFSVDYGKTWKSAPLKFNGVEKNKLFDVWGIILPAMSKPYYYYFKVGNDVPGNEKYYGLYGMSDKAVDDVNRCFYVKPGHSTPDWSKGAYWYSLNVNSFYNGDPVNDHAGQYIDLSGDMDVTTSHYRGMYSGDLKGVQEKLDYIKSYGVDAVYMNPIMPSWDIGGYGFLDTYAIAARNGNEQALIDLTEAMHDKGMHVCLDPVLALLAGNGTLGNSYDIYPLDGAMQSRKSQYYGVFRFWSWPNNFFKRFESPAPNYSDKATQQVIYSEPDSFLQRFTAAPYNVDAFRFDSSIMLWGTDTTKREIVSAFRNAVKSINSDVLFMAENRNSFGDGWDTSWNLPYAWTIRSIADGSASFSQIKDSVTANVNTLPRSAALSSYVYLEDVDQDRMRTNVDKQWQLNAATLFYMTYLGSPALRFGNETDSERTMSARFAAFDWDESTWNYENNYFIRALGELRTNYNCLKDGVVKFGEVNDSQKFMTFARWDGRAAVITAINRRGSTAGRELDVRQFGITDGSVVTDYLTGARYTVENGKINANILAGGTVFVTDDRTCSYRNRFALDLSEGSAAVLSDEGIYELSGNGTVTGKSDSGAIALTPAFGAFGFTSVVDTDGEAALLVKASDDAGAMAYTALIKGGKISVFVRRDNGGAAEEIVSAEISGGSTVGIVRGTDNVFYTAVNGKKLAGSEATVEMPYKVFAGMAVCSGSAHFTSPDLLDEDDICYTDFKSGTLSAVFDLTGGGKVGKGALSLSDGASYTAVAGIGDYTLKAAFGASLSKDGSFAGVAAKDASGDMVFAGRAVVDGAHKIVLARVLSGELAVYASVPDTDAGAECTVQLQRTGNYFTAVYRYGGGKWCQLDSRIHCGLSNPDVGAVVCGDGATMNVSSIGFGNFADGGSSRNAPVSVPGDADKIGNDCTNDLLIIPNWTILTDKADWNYTTGGIRQNKASGTALMVENRTKYTDFRAVATIDIDKGGGSAGMVFCKKKNSAASLNDGYALKLQNGTLSLFCGDKKLAEKSVAVPDDGLRIVVDRVGTLIAVFYGTESLPAFTVNDGTYSSGYFGLYTHDASALFANYDIYSLAYTMWMPYAPGYPVNVGIFSHTTSGVTITPEGESWAATSRKGFAYTDFEAQVAVTEDASGYKGNGYLGFCVGGSEGVSPGREGTVFALKGKNAVVLKGGEEIAKATFNGKRTNTLKIVAEKGVYKVYVNTEKVLEYTDKDYSGGAVALAVYNRKGVFSRFSVTDISNGK